MKYVIATIENDKPQFEAITEEPVEYVWNTEPIDVIGINIVWDENSNRYTFKAARNPDTLKVFGKVSLADTGDWGQDGPQLEKVASGQTDQLKAVLVDFLNKPTKKKSGFLFKKITLVPSDKNIDFTNLSIPRLLREVEKKLANN